MSEEEVVSKVGQLMESLDEVKRYRELAYALVDFVGILVISAIFAVLFVVALGLNAIFSGFSPSSSFIEFGSGLLPVGPLGILGFFIVLVGFLAGVLWVSRRVDRTRTGEWKGTLREGVPGAVKLLEEIDWDSLIGTVSLARLSFLLYAVVKLAGYTLLLLFILTFVNIFLVGLVGYSLSFTVLALTSLFAALLLNMRGLQGAFKRLRSMDLLFWDLRWFYSEFKRAEFNKA